jgi:hypothetical protein
MTERINSSVNLESDDLALRQLFLHADRAVRLPDGDAFVSTVIGAINHAKAVRARQRRSAEQWVATASIIVAAALLPVAVEPLRMAAASWSKIATPELALEIQSDWLMMLVIGLGATGMLTLITRRA